MLCLAASLPAGAQSKPTELPPREHALELFQLGAKLYQAGDYEQAIAAFQRANVLAPSPEYLHNIAQAYRRLGDCGLALKYEREFVRQAPEAQSRAPVQQQLQDLEACANAVPVMVPPTASEAKQAPLATPPRQSLLWGLALGIGEAGLLVGATGGGLWGSAVNDYGRLQSSCGTACSPASISAPQRKLYIGYALVSVGGAAVATGTALLVAGLLQRVPAAVSVAPTAGGLVVYGRY
jgi:tetratricopeptide (TPR) repeat protein